MKKVFKSKEPPLLLTYRTATPNRTWEQFKKGKSRKQQVQEQLRTDQGGLCAYCEIDLKQKDATGEADFRVEHFHPKSEESTVHNWHLDWNNLLGCCHGGSQRDVTDSVHRSTSPDHSCDVPKEDKNLDGIILNPLQLPAFPPLFSTDRPSGKISVNQRNCQIAEVNEITARQTIEELRLNAVRLNRLRQRVLNELNLQLRERLSAGETIQQARRVLAQQQLNKNSRNEWPPFFTSIRSYLGEDAEQHLHSIGFDG